MAESTLSVSFADIRTAVGDYLGIGMDPAGWTSADATRVAGIIKSGLARFYFNPIYSDWSFLKPVASLTTAASQEEYALPDDFGHLISTLTWSSPRNRPYVNIIAEATYRQIKGESPLQIGQPRVACVIPVKMAASVSPNVPVGQRFKIALWPVPAGVYVFEYRYAVLPDAPSDMLYPYGGASHGETILQSCLAVAEQRTNDSSSSNHQQLFERLLLGSIERDRNQAAPHVIGKNTDAGLARGSYTRPTIRARINGVPQ